MNTMIRKLSHLLSPAQADHETVPAVEEGDNLAEADSFLYGDGMGWTGIEISGDGDAADEDNRLSPDAVQQ